MKTARVVLALGNRVYEAQLTGRGIDREIGVVERQVGERDLDAVSGAVYVEVDKDRGVGAVIGDIDFVGGAGAVVGEVARAVGKR